MSRSRVDTPFLIIIILLVVLGFAVFISGAYGILTRSFSFFVSIGFNQFVLGLLLGSLCCFIASRIRSTFWRKYAFYIFILAIVINILVFVPGIGINHGGATRWIDLGITSFQPSELLKIAFVIYFAAWIASVKDKIATAKLGTIPFVVIVAIASVVLLSQKDTDTLMVTVAAGLAMFVAGGGRWRDIAILVFIGIVGIGSVIALRPYVLERVKTFLDPSRDPLGSGYQIQQSLIAIGSGEIFGRGYGQSIQKFKFLPESIGDSIYAVAGEELGFVGAVGIILLFIFFAFRGLKIALNSADMFGGLMVVGIVILITSQAFINIGAMLGVLPLSGIPLPFFSHGGTALFFTLVEMGLILGVSRLERRT